MILLTRFPHYPILVLISKLNTHLTLLRQSPFMPHNIHALLLPPNPKVYNIISGKSVTQSNMFVTGTLYKSCMFVLHKCHVNQCIYDLTVCLWHLIAFYAPACFHLWRTSIRNLIQELFSFPHETNMDLWEVTLTISTPIISIAAADCCFTIATTALFNSRSLAKGWWGGVPSVLSSIIYLDGIRLHICWAF